LLALSLHRKVNNNKKSRKANTLAVQLTIADEAKILISYNFVGSHRFEILGEICGHWPRRGGCHVVFKRHGAVVQWMVLCPGVLVGFRGMSGGLYDGEWSCHC